MKTMCLLSAVMGAVALSSCTSSQSVTLVNASPRDINVRCWTGLRTWGGQPLSAGDSMTYHIANSKNFELLWPVTIYKSATRVRHDEVEIRKVAKYDLPEDFVAGAKRWDDYSWLGQRMFRNAGTVTYRSKNDVTLRAGRQEWKLTPSRE